MDDSIGFVFVTHNQPEQTAYLCSSLSEKFGNPPIAIHHDFSQSHLPIEKLPGNVFLVKDWVRTRWGSISVVEAFLRATRLLFSEADPGWCVNLSSADYPIKSAEQICASLKASPFDALVDHRELRYGHLPRGYKRDQSAGFDDPAYAEMGYDRAAALRIVPYAIYKHLPVLKSLNLQGPLAERLSPFSKDLRPFGGAGWLTFNRLASEAFREDSVLLRRLMRHYKGRYAPDEGLPHTLLAHWPGLKLGHNNHRYVDWSKGGFHPKQLGLEDIPAMVASDGHFARKFSYDPELYREIDRQVAHAGRSLQSVSPVSS